MDLRISALDLGTARNTHRRSCLRAMSCPRLKDERAWKRLGCSKVLHGPKHAPAPGSRGVYRRRAASALYCSKIISYAQGYMLLQAKPRKSMGWHLNLRSNRADVARGLHHPQPRFSKKSKKAFDKNANADPILLLDDFFSKSAEPNITTGWRQRCDPGHRIRRAYAGVFDRALVLRWVPYRPASRESAAGSEGLLWRTHLRTDRQTARRNFSTPTGRGVAGRVSSSGTYNA